MFFVKTREHENKREGEGLIEQNGEHEVWLGFCPTLVVLSSINYWIFHFSLFTFHLNHWILHSSFFTLHLNHWIFHFSLFT